MVALSCSEPSQPKELPKQAPTMEWTDALQKDYDRILSVGEECVTIAEWKDLLLKKAYSTSPEDDPIILYDGFEPSGRMHIAQGIFKAVNVNKCTAYFQTPRVTAKFVFWVADWFALMNDKMGGSLERIQVVGDYLQQVWKAAGMQLEYVQFILASDAITQQAHIYWPLMLDVARRFTISRIKKCCQIMGRLEGNLSAAQMLYPLMQCTDVFFLQADICQLGVDQRKVNMLARDYFEAAKNDNNDKNKKSTRTRLKRPIILSHHMLYGLQKGQAKMSKSNPDSAIFMEDSRDDVERKITLAYCPTQPEREGGESALDENGVVVDPSSLLYNGQVLKNACLDYIQNILFSQIDYTFTAGSKNYGSYIQVQQDFCNGILSVDDIRRGLINAVNDLLDPVRNHFATDPTAQQLLHQVQTFAKEMKAAAESDTPAAKRSVRRANWIGLGAVGAAKPNRIDHVVVAPMPNLQPTLEEAMSLLQQLRHAAAHRQESTSPPCLVMLLCDWSARVVNACTGDETMITSYYDILLAALRALDGSDGVLKYTTIVYQSQAILLEPSDYWIGVINVGRHFSLQDVMGKASIQDDSTVGWVIARLLLVADLLSLAPTSTWSMNFSYRNAEQEETEVAEMITRFWREQSLEKELGFACPQLVKNVLTNTNLKLQAPRPDGLVNETDEYYIIDDPKVQFCFGSFVSAGGFHCAQIRSCLSQSDRSMANPR
jgi:tyrosyl-tRNA synthetase